MLSISRNEIHKFGNQNILFVEKTGRFEKCVKEAFLTEQDTRTIITAIICS